MIFKTTMHRCPVCRIELEEDDVRRISEIGKPKEKPTLKVSDLESSKTKWITNKVKGLIGSKTLEGKPTTDKVVITS